MFNNIDYAGIGNACALSIGRMIMAETGLINLNLCNIYIVVGGNNIGDEGAAIIGDALKNNYSINKLGLCMSML